MAADPDVTSLLAAAYDRRDAPGVVAAVRLLLAGRLSERISALWHPLGFFRLELAVDDRRRRYVVHCWPEGERHVQAPAWLVHRHAFDLESLVIDGVMADRQFAGSESGSPEIRGPLYRAEGTGRDSLLRRSAEVAEIDTVRERLLEPGDFYRVDLSCFHLSEVSPAGSCVTVARLSPKTLPYAKVLGEFGGASLLRYRQHPVEPALLAGLADRVRRL